MSGNKDAVVEGPTLESLVAAMEGSSDKIFRCRSVRRNVPAAHREELYHILKMTGPLVRTDSLFTFPLLSGRSAEQGYTCWKAGACKRRLIADFACQGKG